MQAKQQIVFLVLAALLAACSATSLPQSARGDGQLETLGITSLGGG